MNGLDEIQIARALTGNDGPRRCDEVCAPKAGALPSYIAAVQLDVYVMDEHTFIRRSVT